MQEHARSNWHKEACLLASEHEHSRRQGTVVAMVQSVSQKERAKNRNVMKKLLRCTYFLAKNRVAHTTNFSDLVQLVISCGASDLQRFLHDKVSNNAKYTSTTAVTDFMRTIAQWVERGLIQSLNTASIALDNNFDETLSSFHTRVTDPFISYLTANINSRFADCKDLLIGFSLFHHRHLPAEADPTYKQYGKDKLVRLCEQYGVESEANENGRVIKLSPDIDSELIQEEWMTYRCLLHTQIGDMQERITEVLQSPVYRQLFPNLVKLTSIFLCLPVSTASVERTFSAMKTIKHTQLLF